MHRLALIIGVVAVPALAGADSTERQTFVSVMGGYSLAAPPEASELRQFNHGPLVGLSVAWDREPPEYVRERGGRAVRVELVPEASLLVTGLEGTLLGGVRFQLSESAYEAGLWRMSSRGKIWLAPRVGIGTHAAGPVWGGDLGMAFHTGDIAIGGWLGVYGWKGTTGDMTVFGSQVVGDGPILQVHGGLTFSSSDL